MSVRIASDDGRSDGVVGRTYTLCYSISAYLDLSFNLSRCIRHGQLAGYPYIRLTRFRLALAFRCYGLRSVAYNPTP